ncbi:hypothetical protein OHU34_27935 [Streptomyces sp. NBC_00080]|nr:hypothetical protein [Streptomyces coriariae]
MSAAVPETVRSRPAKYPAAPAPPAPEATPGAARAMPPRPATA